MRVEKNYVDYGFGFPVVIDEVQIESWRKEEIPLIESDELERVLLHKLAFLPARLTGNQVRFIRHHFFETLEEFARKAGVRHSAVMKWERAADGPTSMTWGTEFLIRSRALADAEPAAEEVLAFSSFFESPPEGAQESLFLSLPACAKSSS